MQLNLDVFKTKVNQNVTLQVHNFPNLVYYVSSEPRKFWRRSNNPQFSQCCRLRKSMTRRRLNRPEDRKAVRPSKG